MLAVPGMPLERDAAGHARVVQLVGILGVVAHEVNVPGIVAADETVLPPGHGRVRMRVRRSWNEARPYMVRLMVLMRLT